MNLHEEFMNHSESNLNKLFNQCYISLPDLDNSLSKGLFWPLILLSRGLSLWSWLSLLGWPQPLLSSAPLCRRVLCSHHQCGSTPQLTEALWHFLCHCVRHKELFALVDFPWGSGKPCAKTLWAGHDPRIMALNTGKKILVRSVGENFQLGR